MREKKCKEGFESNMKVNIDKTLYNKGVGVEHWATQYFMLT